MKKQIVVEIFLSGHEEFRDILHRLTFDEIASIRAAGGWSIKDIIAHISAWNWEQVKEIDRTLDDKPSWTRLGSGNISGTDEFNKRACRKRRNWHIKKLIDEWEESFTSLIKRLEKLSCKEWNHVCKGLFYDEGRPVTLQSLFKYEIEGLSDEARHAREIKKILS